MDSSRELPRNDIEGEEQGGDSYIPESFRRRTTESLSASLLDNSPEYQEQHSLLNSTDTKKSTSGPFSRQRKNSQVHQHSLDMDNRSEHSFQGDDSISLVTLKADDAIDSKMASSKTSSKSKGSSPYASYQRASAERANSSWLSSLFGSQRLFEARTIYVNEALDRKGRIKLSKTYPPNVIRNQKYHLLTFVPVLLWNQFKYFNNLFFLLVGISQCFKSLQIAHPFSSVAPLIFVLIATACKEAYDDYQRYLRDKEANSQRYTRLTPDGPVELPSSDIQIGDLIVVRKDQRIPADMILLRTTEHGGAMFIRTDQLDGEIDWKMRVAVSCTQKLPSDYDIFGCDLSLYAEKPHKDIYQFIGTCTVNGAAVAYSNATTSSLNAIGHQNVISAMTSSGRLTTIDRTAPVVTSSNQPENASSSMMTEDSCGHPVESLNEENTLWMNTVVASGIAIGVVIYTGVETRAVMNTSVPCSKHGITDEEMNRMSKVLCFLVFLLSLLMVSFMTFTGLWYFYLIRFIVVFSYIIPISMRVNMDMGKTKYSHEISKDSRIPNVIVRTSTIPEELGRVQFLLTDKTGTLTKNDMELRRLHMGTMCYGPESRMELVAAIAAAMERRQVSASNASNPASAATASSTADKQHHGAATVMAARGRRDQTARIYETMQALALCHNVTPMIDDAELGDAYRTHPPSPTISSKPAIGSNVFGGSPAKDHHHDVWDVEHHGMRSLNAEDARHGKARRPHHMVGDDREEYDDYDKDHYDNGLSLKADSIDGVGASSPTRHVSYQASSPDEIAIVEWCELVGMQLVYRDRERIRLQVAGHYVTYDVLYVFPFTSELKRMGVVVRDVESGEILFLLKGADAVMARIVSTNDWMEEECMNMAREGLRTLVIGRKRLSAEAFSKFDAEYQLARTAVVDRQQSMQMAIEEHLERDLELLAVTGVEDKLQDDVRSTLERLRHAGVRVWMLTGDKVETATNIAVSTRLFGRDKRVLEFQKLKDYTDCVNALASVERYGNDCCMVIDGASLHLMMSEMPEKLVDTTMALEAVVCCRCSPTQKADVARMIQKHAKKRVCCIGDGGNDVSMIQAADVGIGIEGKEGRQASLAADFSITQFSHILRLMVWHGRNSYKRTAKLAMFVIHRGIVISVMQAIFCALFYFSPIALFQGMLSVGYATVYTMFPVFSLTLDQDVTDVVALTYVELYKDLIKGRELTLKVFFKNIMISVFQGAVIMLLALFLFGDHFIHLVSISFTALILNELLMVALEVNTWHYAMVLAEIGSFLVYVASMRFLDSFDQRFITSFSFIGHVATITFVSFAPLYIIWLIRRILSPTSAIKLQA